MKTGTEGGNRGSGCFVTREQEPMGGAKTLFLPMRLTRALAMRGRKTLMMRVKITWLEKHKFEISNAFEQRNKFKTGDKPSYKYQHRRFRRFSGVILIFEQSQPWTRTRNHAFGAM